MAEQRYIESMSHYEHVLTQDPANLSALKGAADCGDKINDGDDDSAKLKQKAKAYRKLWQGLSGQTDNANDSTYVDTSENTTPSNVTRLPTKEKQAGPEKTGDKVVKLHSVEKDDNVTQGPWEDFEAPITLADVGGMEHVKQRLNMAFLGPLKNPEIMKMYGKSLQGGLMLYGPPGCGKTYIARALAGELGATFMSIGLSDVLDMYLGESERRLHEIFEAARRKSPAVLFFDEVDALGQKRSNMRHSAGRTIVNQMLAEMDSVGANNKNVFILAATNHPWDVDTALRRPGRFDRVVLVLPPDQNARVAILEHHLKDRPQQGLKLDEIAARSDHFSGADLAHLVESAAEFAMHDSINSGTARAIDMNDFERALSEVRPSTKPWFETARNYAMFANEGGVYDELLDYLQTHKL